MNYYYSLEKIILKCNLKVKIKKFEEFLNDFF